jgi:cobalamin biosynthesis protein CobD/CbiB
VDQSNLKELSSTSVNAKKLELLIINENDGAYVPLFYFVVDRIMFTA